MLMENASRVVLLVLLFRKDLMALRAAFVQSMALMSPTYDHGLGM